MTINSEPMKDILNDITEKTIKEIFEQNQYFKFFKKKK
jgi:hypothetical protein